jgi:hypothetical protein
MEQGTAIEPRVWRLAVNDLLDHLSAFNRKERFMLVGWALGNPGFALSVDFRQSVGTLLELQLPADAFVAMDYHLDWLYASIYLAYTDFSHEPQQLTDTLTATQEDVDLLVAYRSGDGYKVILLEAKGRTAWSNKQLLSNAKRLKSIFETEHARRL